MADKDFKTIEEQLEILRSRGLTINDESHANEKIHHRIDKEISFCPNGLLWFPQ